MTDLNDHKITQANALVYGASCMTLREKRLFYLAVCKVVIHDNKFLTYSVPVGQLKYYLGLKGNSIRVELKHICESLLTRVVSIETEKGWIAHQYVSHCEYIKAQHSPSGQAVLEIKLHDKVKPFLLQLRNRFQSIKFQYLSKMTSIYAMRIFEILWHKRYENEIPKNEIEIGMDELRKMLKLDKKYINFADFRRKVIDQAQKEIKKNTPIAFTYEDKRRGRKVASITFTVFNNDDYKAVKLPSMTAQMMLELKETDDPIERKKVIVSTINKTVNHDVVYPDKRKDTKTLNEINASTDWAIDQIDKKAKTSNPVKNPAGYIAWAVEHGICKNII